jgi:LCP family protein required for cell wall assembly
VLKNLAKIKRHTLAILIITVLLAASLGWAWSVWVRIHDDPPPPLVQNGEDIPSLPEPAKNITNVLILGIDQLQNEPARADSIMVMSFNEDTDEVSLISIPRDSRVQIPGHGLDKINHAMAYKGEITLMKQTVENLLGVPIHHYIYTNFRGFTNIVDVLGGVTIDVKRPMVHREINNPINLKAGVQHLTGKQALGYVRYRSDNQGDFGRMQRQQEFIRIIAEETLQPKTLLKLPKILEQVARHVRTDMTIPELLDFSRTAARLDPDDVAAIALPGRNININGISYVALDEEVLAETIKNYLRWEE